MHLLLFAGRRPPHYLILVAAVERTAVVRAHPRAGIEVQVAPAALGSLVEPLLILVQVVTHHEEPPQVTRICQDALGA